MDKDKIIKEYMSKLGKKSAESLTVEQRKERASKAVKEKWRRWRENKAKELPE